MGIRVIAMKPLTDILGPDLAIRTPPARSSDWGLIRSDPLKYLLSRRLGLVPLLRHSEALNRGSWFHRACQGHLNADLSEGALGDELRDSCDALKEACSKVGADSEVVLEREREDFHTALAWFGGASQVKCGPGGTFIDYLTNPKYELIGTEITIHVKVHGIPCVAQLDVLLLDREQNALWIVDYKTTSKKPTQRLATCPIEFQTLHYSHILWSAIITGGLRTPLGLSGVDIGSVGMIHIAIQKPTINLGMKDRDYEEYEHTLLSGPRKGEQEIRRTYSGDPKPENYRSRCVDWYLGRNEFTDRADDTEAPVNISETPHGTIFDEYHTRIYMMMLLDINRFRLMSPYVGDFPPGNPAMGYESNPYEPFYLLPPEYWESIIEREGFHVVDRDADIPPCPGVKLNASSVHSNI